MSENGYVRPDRVRETLDLASLASGYLSITECPGGRKVVKGYVCAHCGVDYTLEADFCGQPVDEDGQTVFNAAVARRIMEEGEQG